MITRWWMLLCILLGALPLLAATDDEEAIKRGVNPPAEWIFPAARPLRVLEVRGRWYPYYAMDRALARLGGASITPSWHQPQTVRYYPETYEELMSQHLVIVGNINGDAFGPVRRAMLKQYVQAGGAVLFLGGRLAFGHSFHGAALEEIAPVTFADKDDVTAAPPDGLLLANGPDAIGKGFAALPWTEQPRLFWYHDGLTLKPGAQVLLTAGGKPLLITGTYGKGRVAVFAGTVLGDPQPGQCAFWTWQGWPDIMAATIDWLTEPVRAADPKLSVEGLTALARRLLGTRVKHAAEIAPRLTRAADTCRDRETARLLTKAIADLEGNIPLDLADAVDDAARPYADATFAPEIENLLAGPQSSKVSLGLRLLGQIHGVEMRRSKFFTLGQRLESEIHNAEVRQKLEAAFAEPGEGGPRDAAEGGDHADVVVEDEKDVSYAVRIGALEGLGNLGNADALPGLREAIKTFSRARSDPAKYPYEVTREDELYQEAVLAALRCGDAAQAGPTVDLLLENRYVLIRMMSYLDSPLYSGPEFETERIRHKQIARNLPRVWARQERLYHRLSGLSDSVLPALAARLAVEDDPRAAAIAFAIFGAGVTTTTVKLSPPVVETLRKAALPAIADLVVTAEK